MIEIKNVCKNFGDLEVLKGINITINDGEIYGIIGQSGAGKSTLLRCVNGLESYQDGSITVDGVIVDQKDKKSLRNLQKGMGMIFQNFNLLSRLDVYDNVALPMKFWGINTKTDEAKEKIEGLLKLVDLQDKIHSDVDELSGGQQQRLCIARALAMSPEVLLMDEPTSALDPISTKKIEELVMSLKERYTIVIVTHNLQQAARIADYTSFFLLGDLVETNKTETLFSRPSNEKTERYITGRFG